MPIVSVEGRDDAGRSTSRRAEIAALDLQWRAVTGTLPASTQVHTEDGRAVPALRWLADEGGIAVEPDRDALQFIRSHTARHITRRAAFDILDQTDDPMAHEESIDLTEARRVIGIPDWAAHEAFEPAEIGSTVARTPITPAAWAAWLEPPVVRRISPPPWGLGFELPADAAIAIPPWIDPTEGAMPALPEVAVRWRPAKGAQPPTTPDEQPVWQEARPEAFVAPLGGMGGVMETAQADGGVSAPEARPVELAARPTVQPRRGDRRARRRASKPPPRVVRAAKADEQADAARAREILDRARARRRDRLEALRGAVADERGEAAPPADAPPNAAKPPTLAADADVIRLGARSDVDLRGKATQTTTSLGLWGCLGKLMVLQALAVAALVVLNLGVQLVMEALGTHVASVDTSDPRTTGVSPALAPTTPPLRGGADEPLARIVFGFDPTDPAGWRVAAAVARLQDHRAEGTGWRLLLQPSDADGYRVAFEVHELLAAGLPAATLLDTLRVPSGAGGLRGRIDALRRDSAVAPARLRRDDEAHLRALARRVTQDAATSAALGIHEGTSGLLLGGEWIPPEDAGPAVLLERLRAEALDVAAALEVAPDDAARLQARLAGPTVSRRVAWNDLVVKGLPPAVDDGRVDNALRMALGSDAPSRQVRLRVPRRAPTQGSAEAPVQLVVVHDYRDAASRALAEDVERLRLAWGDTVVVRWMFAPGDGGHDHGDGDHAAALVALSAAQQGGFDAAHAALLEAEGQMSPAAVSAWVDELAARDPGFDAARFGRDLRRAPRSLRRMRSRLDKVGVRSAPAVLVGRQLLDGVPDYASLDRAVQREAAQRGEQGAP